MFLKNRKSIVTAPKEFIVPVKNCTNMNEEHEYLFWDVFSWPGQDTNAQGPRAHMWLRSIGHKKR